MDETNTLTIWIESPFNPASWRIQVLDAVSIEGKPGHFQVSNYQLGRDDGKFFAQTAVTDHWVDGEGNKHPYLKNLMFEQDHGRDSVGEVVAVLRKSPQGRWYVDVDYETIFISPTESFQGMRLTRSSKSNVEQALKKHPDITVENKWTNSARIGGKQTLIHIIIAGFSAQLAQSGKSVDIFRYSEERTDHAGGSALWEALRKIPDRQIAQEIFEQAYHPKVTH